MLPWTSVGRPARSELKRSTRPVVEREHVVLDGLDQEQPLQLARACRACSAARSWAWVQSLGVVELPDVVVERGQLAAHHPRRAVPGDRGPALVVDAAVAEHLEVLGLVRLRGVRRRRSE